MEYINLNTQDIKTQALEITQQLYGDSINWQPDYIVGINRGGLTPAVMLSHFLNKPMYTLDIRLRDGAREPESNIKMAFDAWEGKNILIVDDINDTGATFQWIKKDWVSSMAGAYAPALQIATGAREIVNWDKVWGWNVRFAVLVDNEGSEFKDVTYSALTINKTENPSWVVFPWENWWHDTNW